MYKFRIFFSFLKTIFRNGFKLLPTVIFTDMYVIQHFIGLKKKHLSKAENPILKRN